MTGEIGELTGQELRVIGALAEKELTTPDQYPLTLNSLMLACNQRSSRDPVVNYDESTVEQAVTSAKTKGFARFVHPSHGRSVVRYAHTVEEVLGLSRRQLALMAVLVLRGAQTPGELRARTDRMAEFEDLADLERELDRLRDLEVPLVEKLARRPGQSQDRFRHRLGGAEAAGGGVGRAEVDGESGPRPPSSPAHEAGRTPADQSTSSEVSEIRSELANLRSEVGELRRELDELRSGLGG